MLYFRPQKNCTTSDDGIQYMPLEDGAFEWDLFPQDQAAAPINFNGWGSIECPPLLDRPRNRSPAGNISLIPRVSVTVGRVVTNNVLPRKLQH